MSYNFSIAKAFSESETFLTSVKDRFAEFYSLTPDKVSLSYFQYFQLAAAANGWKPDLIIELGRAYGNSTFAFTEAMNATGGKVISLCNKDDWQATILPKIKHLVDAKWEAHLDARTVDNFVEVDLTKEISAYKRIMIFWDAHGFQTAEYVLGYLLPLMKGKEYVVAMHDITDMSFYITDNSYHQQRLWRSETANEGSVKVRLNGFLSSSEQLISVLDFCNRNELTLKSADASLRNEMPEAVAAKFKSDLGEGFSLDAHWVYFQLNANSDYEKLTFPVFNRELILAENRFKEKYLEAYHNNISTIDFDLGSFKTKAGFFHRLKTAVKFLING